VDKQRHSRRLAGESAEKVPELGALSRKRKEPKQKSSIVVEPTQSNHATPPAEKKPEQDIFAYTANKVTVKSHVLEIRAKAEYVKKTPSKQPQHRALVLPTKGSAQEAELVQRIREIKLPAITSETTADEVNEAVEQVCRGLRHAADVANPPPSPCNWKSRKVIQLSKELSRLTLLSHATNDADRLEHIGTLRVSKRLFNLASPDRYRRSTIRQARRLVGRTLRDALRARDMKRARTAQAARPLTELFKKHPRKCLEAIKNGDGSKTCRISEEALCAYYEKTLRGSKSATSDLLFDISPLVEAPGVRETRPRPCTAEEDIGEELTLEEVDKAFKGANKNSAPGIDRLCLKLTGLGGARLLKWLARLFERIRVLRVIPKCWKCGEVQLIFKKGDELDPSNWRPITLLAVWFKLLMTLLGSRVHQADQERRDEDGRAFISECQRGFRPSMSGCTDNGALLKSWEREVAESGVAYIGFIDFKNAFGSLDHSVIWQVLEWLCIPKYICEIVKSAYDGASIRIRYGDKKVTAEITVERGVLQGCPLSPTIFALAIEPLLRLLTSMSKSKVGIQAKADCAAYADDVGLFAIKRAMSQHFSKGLELNYLCSGLEVNVKKSAATCIEIDKKGRRRGSDPKLSYGSDGLMFACLKGVETYMYLGAEAAGACVERPTVTRLLNIIESNGALLHAAAIPPWMKRHLYIHYIIPKVLYTLQIWHLSPAAREKIDLANRRVAKGIEGITKRFCTAALRSPIFAAGLGYPDLVGAAPIQFAMPYLRRLLKGDCQIQGMEMTRLLEEINRCRRNDERPPLVAPSSLSMKDVKGWLDVGSSPRDLFEPVSLLASLDLVLLGLNSPCPYAQVATEDSSMKLPTIRAALMQQLDEEHLLDWSLMKLEGEVAEANVNVQRAPASCQCPWLSHPAAFSPFVRRFAILCSTNNISCATNHVRWKFHNDPLCTRCSGKNVQESTSHVLNRCKSRLPLYLDRHNAALKELTRAFAKKDCSLLIDSTPHLDVNRSGTTLRPDLIITQAMRAAILDVKCPFPTRRRDGRSYAERTDLANRTKYHDISSEYERKYPSATSLGTVIIPTAGPVPDITRSALVSAGLTRSEACLTIRRMSVAMVRANAKLASTLRAPSQQSPATPPTLSSLD
jgi:Reverse transcriptase (RNA-dependent DNA polymerase)